MVTEIVSVVTELMSGLSAGFAEVVKNITGMFWVAGTGDTGGSLTILGIFALVSLVMSIIFWTINLVRSFIKVRSR